jgi:sec-independent protein translocase protein TatC
MSDSDASSEMTILSHFEELRSRLLKALGALVISTLLSMLVTEQGIHLLALPIGGISQLQSIEVTENVGVFMRVSLTLGVILAMPVIVYQLLMFVLPGLLPGEKKWVAIGVPLATIFFLAGVAFAYFVMLTPAVNFLVQFLGVVTTPRLSNYIGFVTNLLFWMGICFESPLLVFILAKLKIVTGKGLLRQWRIALVVIAVISAAVTPTVDPVNMVLLMLPLAFLYQVSVLLAFLAR